MTQQASVYTVKYGSDPLYDSVEINGKTPKAGRRPKGPVTV